MEQQEINRYNETKTKKYMRRLNDANQRLVCANFVYNARSPYSWYFIYDEKKNKKVFIPVMSKNKHNGDDTGNFSLIDIEYQNRDVVEWVEFSEGYASPMWQIKDIINKTKESTTDALVFDKTLPRKYARYLSCIYNSFPAVLRKVAFAKDDRTGDLKMTEKGVKLLSNVWKIVVESYNHRSLDSLDETLWWANNFDILSAITKPEDMQHVFDLLDHLLLPWKNFWKKIIFLNRAISLLAFLWGIDVNQIKTDFAWLGDYFRWQNIWRDDSKVKIEERFKDMYSVVQKLISQPSNNDFLSDLQWFRFTYDSKEDLQEGIEQQYVSVVHYINDINKNPLSRYEYKIKSMSISNKWVLTPEEEAIVIGKVNNNSLIKNNREIKKRNKKKNSVSYDENIIKEILASYPNESEDTVKSLLISATSMSTWSNWEYADIKPIIMVTVTDKVTGEERDFWVEIQNVLKNNNNNYYNRANHNFLEAQKHTLSRARDKWYNTTQTIYKYIAKAVMANSKDLIKLRNKIDNNEVLETRERYEEQCFYTTETWEKIDLRNITNDLSGANKKSIDLIVYDLLQSWLREGRLCIDNSNEDRKKLEKWLYDENWELLHITFRGQNIINNLETTRLQLNQPENPNVKNTWRIIFFPFWSEKDKNPLASSTEVLRRIVQRQLVLENEDYLTNEAA